MKEITILKAHFLRDTRNFFEQKGFLEAITPPLVQNPGMEPHIHPFKVIGAKDNQNVGYLHTSPEFHMKELLSHGLEKIYNIGHCFRDEPHSEHHRNQFIMLEWYRSNCHYDVIKKDVIDLITYLIKNNQFVHPFYAENSWSEYTVDELFKDICGFSILDHLDEYSLRSVIKNKFPEVPLPPEQLLWEDLFFLIFLNKVEPRLKEIPLLIIKEYPHHLSALSTLKELDPRVCERFEVYINGVEIGNCFNELTNYDEQMKRFSMASSLKNKLYGYNLPHPQIMDASLKRGLPNSAGIAIGLERLMAQLTKKDHCFWSE